MSGCVEFKKLLLHICCGPCALWPLERLLEEGVDLSLFFYNPNIHPQVEWERRLDNAIRVADHYRVPLIVQGSSSEQEWQKRANDGDERCSYCYRVRFSHVAELAGAQGFDAISTTLLVSPWQKRDRILQEGQRVAAGRGIAFLPYDWREGYRKGQAMARDLGLYRQKYCGCVISLGESSFRESITKDHQELTRRREGSAGLT
ncbi:MAG: epoxyqueuosine reductase QueH [Clostridiaceae bacterium]|nr:epoxyqueuosine reductase QueH [Clostridiaceae bacterium]